MLEPLAIIWMGCLARLRRFSEWTRVIWRYYGTAGFARVHLGLGLHYLTRGPYQICKEYHLSAGHRDIYSYGETFLTTLEKIAQRCNLGPSDRFYELGCGTGLTALWLRQFVGCSVVGIEQVPRFVRVARRVLQRSNLDRVTFKESDFATVDLSDATAIYFYGTGFPDPVVRSLVKQLETMGPEAKLISVSYPLTDYASAGQFELVDQFTGHFPWGRGTIYVQINRQPRRDAPTTRPDSA